MLTSGADPRPHMAQCRSALYPAGLSFSPFMMGRGWGRDRVRHRLLLKSYAHARQALFALATI
jgi:hypothetical protein